MVGNGRGRCLPGNLRRTDGYMPIPFLKSLLFAAIWFLLLVCTIPTSVAESASGPAITLTTDERAWLAAHPDIRLAYPPGHEPTLMRDDDGKLVGVLADYWNLLNTRMGTNFKLELVPWLEVDDLVKQNRIDGLAISTSKKNEALGLIPTELVFQSYAVVYGHVSKESFRFPEDLTGKRLAILKGYNHTTAAIAPVRDTASFIEVMTPRDGLRAVHQRKADYFIGSASNNYLISKYQFFGLGPSYVLWDKPYTTRTSVRSDLPELAAILNRGAGLITDREFKSIIAKWSNLPASKDTIKFTSEERDWLKANPLINVGVFSVPPYMFKENGKIQGYLIDIMEILVRQAGLTAEFSMQPLAETLTKVNSGQYHAIPGMIHSAERAGFLFFSKNVMNLQMSVFARSSRLDIHDVASLESKVIASYNGYGFEPVIKKYLPDAKIIRAEDAEGMLRLVASGEADAAVQELYSGEFILRDSFINGVNRKGNFDPPGFPALTGSEFAVSRKFPLLNSILNKSYNTLPESEKIRVWRKWFASDTEQKKTIELTPGEQAWLDQNHKVRVRAADWPPYLIVKENEPPQGIAIEYLKLIEERTGLTFEYEMAKQSFAEFLESIKQRQGPDMTSLIVQTPGREQYLSFTTPYISSPYVIFAREQKETLLDISGLSGKALAVPRGFVMQQLLEKDYPEIRLVLFENDEQSLAALSSGKVDAYIGNLTVASHLIQKRGLSNLRVVAPTPYGDQVLSMGNRNDWPELTTIIDKALASITEAEKTDIRNKYVALRVEQGINRAAVLKWVLLVVGGAFGVVIFFTFWNRSLAKKVRQRTDELESSNESLVSEVVERTKAEKALRESRNYLENLTNSLPDAVFLVKMPERVIEWAKGTENVLGYEPGECVGKTTEFLYPDRKDFIEFGDKIQRAIAAGDDIFHIEQTLKNKSGDLFPVDIDVSLFRIDQSVVSVTAIVRNITNRKRAEQEIQLYQQRLKSLASQLTIAEEKERHKIAADLHDHVGHSLALARMQLNGILESDSALERNILVKDISNIMLQALQETRSLIFELSTQSMNDIGLAAAISEWLEEKIEKRHGLKTECSGTIAKKHQKTLDENELTLLFRSVRELLTNVVKHARANKVAVLLGEQDNDISITIEDDGIGFDRNALKSNHGQKGGFGLFSIQERMTNMGGVFDIQSEPGKGCRVVLTVPVGEGRKD